MTAAVKTVKVRGPKGDLMDKVIAKINAGRPKGPGARQIDFEVTRSTVTIMSKVKYVLSTGIEAYDGAIGIGGLPFGRVTELYGTDGCVAADTRVAYLVCKGGNLGRLQNTKGGTIEKLWHRFHGVIMPGKGHYQRPQTVNSEFYVPAVNEVGRIIRNRVVDVVKTGQKECFRIVTEGGRTIEATADHKFFVGDRYAPLADLAVGGQLWVHNATPYTVDNKVVKRYKSLNVKWFHRGKSKLVNGCRYYIVPEHRFVYEAALNGLTSKAYKTLLDSGISALPEGWKTIPPGYEVHHKDDVRTHNWIENLEAYSELEHLRLHAHRDHNRLRFMIVPDQIKSITYVGVKPTYDIKCLAPHNNYIANEFAVHNSGKTAMALRCAVRMQQKFIFERVKVEGQAVPDLRQVSSDVPIFTIFIDNEQSIDEDGKVKIDGTQLDVAVARCDTVDQMFKIIDVTIDTMDAATRELNVECFIAVICDTLAGTSSREEMTDKWDKVDYSRQARQLREGFRIMMRKFSRRNVLGIFTNQVGDKFDKAKSYGPKSNVAQDSDFNTFGGRALKFFASLRIFHAVQNAHYKLDKGLRFPSGRSIAFTVTKNRMGKPFRSGRLVLLYEGGLNNIFSKLETLLALKLAEYGDKDAGETGIKFRFKSAGIEPVTFVAKDKERERTPSLEGPLASWPSFYEEHQTDLDRLWRHALLLMQQEEVLGVGGDAIDLDETESDVDLDES